MLNKKAIETHKCFLSLKEQFSRKIQSLQLSFFNKQSTQICVEDFLVVFFPVSYFSQINYIKTSKSLFSSLKICLYWTANFESVAMP